jgi:hypothetical protein
MIEKQNFSKSEHPQSESILFSTDGTANPYLVVPTINFESLKNFFNENKVDGCSGGTEINDRKDNLVEIIRYTFELENSVDVWLSTNGKNVEKIKDGPENSPTRITWHYDPAD